MNNKNNNNKWILLIVAFLMAFVLSSSLSTWIAKNEKDQVIDTTEETEEVQPATIPEDQIKFSELIKDLKKNKVLELKMTNTVIYVTMKDGTEYKCGYIDRDTLMEALSESDALYYTDIPAQSSTALSIIITLLPMFILIFGVGLMQYFIFRKTTNKSVGIDVSKDTKTTFADIAGQDEAKESVMEIVNYLKNPSAYKKIGARQPKGALLVGPPGTGKTLLAKAIAGEAGVSFISTSGSEFVEMFVGVGASRVRSLFKKARQNSPCIIFIDEIDAIGKKRSTGATSSEHESTLTQILKEMDGFTPDSNIVVLAATNQPETLDSALVRPGRFDRHIPLVNPDLKGRIDILKIHLKNIIHDEVDYNHIALMTAGCSGADIANIVNEAAMTAVRRNEASVNTKHLEEAIEVVLAGKVKKSTILSKHEKELVAYHEIGHALVSMRLKNTKPIQKITIIPRTLGALGFVMHTPEDERFLQTKSEIVSDITVLLAGRCAEELMYNDCTTGASNDIEKATSMARAYVTKFGMSDKFGMIKLEGDNSQYLNTGSYRICSEETMTNVDNEVIKLLKECKENAMEILVNNKVLLLILAGVLVQEETIDGKRFMDIVAHVDSEQS